MILFLPLTKAGEVGGWDPVSGSPSTISREGSGRQGASSDSREATQHALVLSRKQVPGRWAEWLLSPHATFVGFEMRTAELRGHTDKGWKDGVMRAAALWVYRRYSHQEDLLFL